MNGHHAGRGSHPARATRTALAAVVAALLLAGCSGDDGSGPFGASTPAGSGSASTSASVSASASASASASTSASTSAAPADGARFGDPDAVAAIVRDTGAGLTAVNTYDYRHLATARTNALAHITGSLRTNYLRTFSSVIMTNASRLQVRQRAVVSDVGIGAVSGSGTQATVLAFGHLDVTTTQSPDGRRDPFSAVVTLSRSGGRWLLSDIMVRGTLAGTVPGTPDLRTAVAYARSCAGRIVSYRRDQFDADYNSALGCTTGSIRAGLVGRRAATRRALTAGGYDLAARILAVGVEAADGGQVTVLVGLTGFRVTARGRAGSTDQRLRLVMEPYAGGRWVISDLRNVG